jgi:ribosome-binding protein aMBF1 (putative translation factor)
MRVEGTAPLHLAGEENAGEHSMFERRHNGARQPRHWPRSENDRPFPAAAEEPLRRVLGRRLSWLRVERGMSLKTVADRLGLPLELIEGYELGTATIQARQLVAYARLFDVPISSFFQDPPTTANA